MNIQLTDKLLEIVKDGNKLAMREPIEARALVVEITSGKQVVTYSLTELEVRAVYEFLKGRIK